MSRELGLKGEEIALNFLIEKGYELVERNFTARSGEIDLILMDKDTMVFVEVKYYGKNNFADIHLSLTSSKKMKLRKTINVYLSEIDQEIPARLDVVLISNENEQNKIEHFQGIEI